MSSLSKRQCVESRLKPYVGDDTLSEEYVLLLENLRIVVNSKLKEQERAVSPFACTFDDIANISSIAEALELVSLMSNNGIFNLKDCDTTQTTWPCIFSSIKECEAALSKCQQLPQADHVYKYGQELEFIVKKSEINSSESPVTAITKVLTEAYLTQLATYLDEKHIAHGYQFFINQKEAYVITESGQSDMFSYSEQNIQMKVSWWYDVMSGIKWLHGWGVVNRDIKLENIIILNDSCKLIDLEDCCYPENITSQIGTPKSYPRDLYRSCNNSIPPHIYYKGDWYALVLTILDYFSVTHIKNVYDFAPVLETQLQKTLKEARLTIPYMSHHHLLLCKELIQMIN